jgi:uncharacterized protein YdhG (YjbR/CyaY superfamily)
MQIKFENTEEYISSFSPEIQKHLLQVRAAIKKAAPHAEEGFSYGMPAYKFHGKPLVYFAGFKNHIGFYATPQGHQAFQNELSEYKQGKGSVQFPVNEPMPIKLIIAIVKFKSAQILKF